MKPEGRPPDDELRLVRPYAMTAGRTRAKVGYLAMEAIVVRTPEGEAASELRHESREIMAMCSAPVSIAEIAARLRVPLGAARVLVGDLLADGLVRVDQPAHPDARPDIRLLERVLDGLSAL